MRAIPFVVLLALLAPNAGALLGTARDVAVGTLTVGDCTAPALYDLRIVWTSYSRGTGSLAVRSDCGDRDFAAMACRMMDHGDAYCTLDSPTEYVSTGWSGPFVEVLLFHYVRHRYDGSGPWEDGDAFGVPVDARV